MLLQNNNWIWPSAVCYKIATDPNLKTSNWLKTAGCTYHKSTHSVVEIRTGIPTLLYIFIMFYLFSVFLKQCSHTEGLLWQVLGLRKSRCSFEVETYVCGIVTTFTAQKNMFNASLARNGSPRTSFPKILALMMQWLFWKMEFQTRTRKCYAGCTRINWKCWRLAVTTLFIFENQPWGDTSFCFAPYADQFRGGTSWNQSSKSHGLHIGASNSLTMSHVCLLCNYANICKRICVICEIVARIGGNVGIHGWPRTIFAWCPQSNWQNNFRKSPKQKPGRPLKKWQDKLGKFCERDFGRFIRVVDGGSENSWVVFPRRSAVILSLFMSTVKTPLILSPMSFQDRSFQLERAQSKANSWNSWLWNSTAQVCIWTLHWFVGRAVGQKKYRGRTSPRHLKRRGPALLQTHLTYKHIAVHFRLFFFWRWQLIRYHVPDGWTGNRFFFAMPIRECKPWSRQIMLGPD